ncbi:MAG TPA: HD domain-containing protein [Thermodesulfobacteriota bacterium]
MPTQIYRDPVHNIIALDRGDREDRLLIDLVDCPEVQRLRRVRQLGLAVYAYAGADHSRFSHSVGVMHVARRILSRLGRDHAIDPWDRLVTAAAALLHDVGHWPFSHVVEDIVGERHERWSVRLVEDPDGALHRRLAALDPRLPAAVAERMRHGGRPRFLADLVASQLDADRFDYLLRDSLMTGVTYGQYDLEWILETLAVDPAGDRIVVHEKGHLAVVAYLQARHHMYQQVYFHKTVRAADVMLRALIGRAVDLARGGALAFPAAGSPLGRALGDGASLAPRDFLALDDATLLHAMRVWAADPDPVLADLASRLLDRRLFKTVEVPPARYQDLPALAAEAGEVIRQAGGDPRYYLQVDRAADTPYRTYGADSEASPGGTIAVHRPARTPAFVEIRDLSPAVEGLARDRRDIIRLCFPDRIGDREVRSTIEALVGAARDEDD